MKHMFAKTHTLRQAGLLRLLQASTPAVRASWPFVLPMSIWRPAFTKTSN